MRGRRRVLMWRVPEQLHMGSRGASIHAQCLTSIWRSETRLLLMMQNASNTAGYDSTFSDSCPLCAICMQIFWTASAFSGLTSAILATAHQVVFPANIKRLTKQSAAGSAMNSAVPLKFSSGVTIFASHIEMWHNKWKRIAQEKFEGLWKAQYGWIGCCLSCPRVLHISEWGVVELKEIRARKERKKTGRADIFHVLQAEEFAKASAAAYLKPVVELLPATHDILRHVTTNYNPIRRLCAQESMLHWLCSIWKSGLRNTMPMLSKSDLTKFYVFEEQQEQFSRIPAVLQICNSDLPWSFDQYDLMPNAS